MKALVVEDDQDIAEIVAETLTSMGHDHEWVKSQQDARERIHGGGYHYVLLDLQIPVRTGHGLPCIEYGEHLAKEIYKSPAMQGVPIIAMTAFGKEGLEIAAPLCEHGVVDFIHKPFPRSGRTLASVIQATLDRTRRARETLAALSRDQQPTVPFQGGELVFLEDRIELCGVKVVGAAQSSQMCEILTCLAVWLPNGRYKAFDGTALAREIGASGGQGSIAGSIRDFRRHVADVLGREIGVKVGSQDVIESGSAGYRLKPWIMIRSAPVVPSPAASAAMPDGRAARIERILQMLRDKRPLRIPDLADQLKCSSSTAKRLLEELRGQGKIVFEGAPRNGSYRLA